MISPQTLFAASGASLGEISLRLAPLAAKSFAEEFIVNERQRQLLTLIDRAFAGVELGDGVSLHETQVIDEYGTAEARRSAREPDEKHNWRKLIDHPDLPVFLGPYSGLCFLDTAGVRFHLPACLSRVVRAPEEDGCADLRQNLMFLLIDLSEYSCERLAILSTEQRECVREVLVYLRSVGVLAGEPLDRAIKGYWSVEPR